MQYFKETQQIDSEQFNLIKAKKIYFGNFKDEYVEEIYRNYSTLSSAIKNNWIYLDNQDEW